MSAISGYISQIQTAVYGEQVRSSIVNALLACYSDVENPDLQSAAFLAAIEEAYDGGILDITEVTQVSQMTNENIIYRYMGTQAGYMANTLYYHNGSAWVPLGSGVLTASTVAGMTNTSAIYKYTGSESGYTANALYYYNGTAWTKILGASNSPTDTNIPADGIIDTIDQGGIGTNGIKKSYSAWKISDYLTIVPGSVLQYCGAGYVGGNEPLVPLAFYDADKTFISCVLPDESDFLHIYNQGWLANPSNGISINAGRVVVPATAYYCRICGYGTMKPFINYAFHNRWMGKKCVFFGDSITFGVNAIAVERYSNYLSMLKGITPANYAVNGSILVTNGMDRLLAFVSDYSDAAAPDAFFWAYGTNDWYNNKPIGEWYEVAENGTRTLTTDATTFKGALANIVTYIKNNYEGSRIIVMTPIRRGSVGAISDLARNSNGNYLSDFANAIKEAKDVLGVEVIDLYGESGLNPNINTSTKYFTQSDHLHPNSAGHLQIAKTISAKLDGISLE